MKLSLAFLAAALVSLVSAQPNHWRFKIRATTQRFAIPAFSGYVDLSPAGVASFNTSSVGFVSYMDSLPGASLPRGTLHKESGNLPGFLNPISPPGMHDFLFGPLPSEVGVLSSDFAITDLSCGGQCGGLQLVYAIGRWFAFDDGSGGWRIRYWNGAGDPEGGSALWLLREAA